MKRKNIGKIKSGWTLHRRGRLYEAYHSQYEVRIAANDRDWVVAHALELTAIWAAAEKQTQKIEARLTGKEIVQ